jgi:hypothetical protein
VIKHECLLRHASQAGGVAIFKWHRHYRAGLLDPAGIVVPLLPVAVSRSPAIPPSAASQPAVTTPAPDSNAAIESVFDDCMVRVGGAADMKTLRAVLALLRQ